MPDGIGPLRAHHVCATAGHHAQQVRVKLEDAIAAFREPARAWRSAIRPDPELHLHAAGGGVGIQRLARQHELPDLPLRHLQRKAGGAVLLVPFADDWRVLVYRQFGPAEKLLELLHRPDGNHGQLLETRARVRFLQYLSGGSFLRRTGDCAARLPQKHLKDRR